jgi:probable rRNA maturation factor
MRSPTTNRSRHSVSVTNTLRGRKIDARAVARAVRAALHAESCPRAAVSVALVDDDAMAELPQRHMDVAGPTDVLTFDLREDAAAAVDGEIVISLDTAAREAATRGHEAQHEVILYAIHGVLHLLGYDDRTAAKFRRMHAREDEILTQLGLGAVYAREIPPAPRPARLHPPAQSRRAKGRRS